MNNMKLQGALQTMLDELEKLGRDARIAALNEIRDALHNHSPFAEEPVDCVIWVPGDRVTSNDYNPNRVAPPEMRLLEHSIAVDGFTQPIVVWERDETYEVVDGFHRSKVGRNGIISERLFGYMPVSRIQHCRSRRGDRMSATIRHNRARGVHRVDGMSEIVVELTRRNWSTARMSRELGMEPDEILRLKQISGLAEMFANREFSEAWDVPQNPTAE